MGEEGIQGGNYGGNGTRRKYGVYLRITGYLEQHGKRKTGALAGLKTNACSMLVADHVGRFTVFTPFKRHLRGRLQILEVGKFYFPRHMTRWSTRGIQSVMTIVPTPL